MENLFLRRNSTHQMITLTQQAVSTALQFEAGRDGFEKQLSSLEVGFCLIDVVRVFKKKSSDAKTGFDFDNWQERDLRLANSFKALHCLAYLPLLLLVISQSP